MFSVVIPTLNSSQALEALLTQLSSAADDIVITDGGSGDESLLMAVRGKSRIAIGGGGRGGQLARGALWSKAQEPQDWLLFLHADSVLPEGWERAVKRHMESNGEKAAYFKFKLDDRGFWPRFVELTVALRCWALALPYGDQGMLIRKDLYGSIGGYPDWPLFEDVDIARKLGRRRLISISLPLLTDASKYRRDGYARRTLKNLGLLTRFLSGTSAIELARRYR